ncbi:hypothetical protein AERYTH_02530 [Aeromicrobium erythreum]|uniref:DUF306 domain-containing protein n=1 Tax=Aeromicrobium erythreum TaxID=2041 RepID=A0A0U4CDX9_9ACTN|nr:hypothetical protein AERYTH_02530 [Aeromicrobium erythreum]
MVVALVVGTALAVGGCQGGSSHPAPSASSSPPTAHDATRAEVVGLWTAGRSSSRLPVQVELRADGGVSGSDGCNSFSGRRWSLDGDRVRLRGAPLTSLVACSTVPGQWLSESSSFRVEEGRLVALDRRHEPLGSLSRTSS